jgi:hypothetical protein
MKRSLSNTIYLHIKYAKNLNKIEITFQSKYRNLAPNDYFH